MEATEERKKWKKKTQDKSRKPIPAESSHEEPSKEERQNDVRKGQLIIIRVTFTCYDHKIKSKSRKYRRETPGREYASGSE